MGPLQQEIRPSTTSTRARSKATQIRGRIRLLKNPMFECNVCKEEKERVEYILESRVAWYNRHVEGK